MYTYMDSGNLIILREKKTIKKEAEKVEDIINLQVEIEQAEEQEQDGFVGADAFRMTGIDAAEDGGDVVKSLSTETNTSPIVKFIQNGMPKKAEGTYIRFGELPIGPSGKFMNGERFGSEKGQSVYLAYKNPKTGKYIVLPTETDETELGEYIATADDIAEGRKVFEVSGEVLPYVGSDGEPLIKVGSGKIVAEINPADIVFASDTTTNILGEKLDSPVDYDEETSTDDMPEGITIPNVEMRQSNGGWQVFDVERNEFIGPLVGETIKQKTLENYIRDDIALQKFRKTQNSNTKPLEQTD